MYPAYFLFDFENISTASAPAHFRQATLALAATQDSTAMNQLPMIMLSKVNRLLLRQFDPANIKIRDRNECFPW